MKTKGTIWACDGPECEEIKVTKEARELPPQWLVLGLVIPGNEEDKGRLTFHSSDCAAVFFADAENGLPR